MKSKRMSTFRFLTLVTVLGGCRNIGDQCPTPTISADAASDAERPPRVLVYTRTTGWVHESIPHAAEVLAQVIAREGWTADVSADPARFAPANLATYGAVILISTTGEPLGPVGSTENRAFEAYVRQGGGLLGIHAVDDAYYDCSAWPTLIGGLFRSHPGDVRRVECSAGPEMHPAVAQLPTPYLITDEIHVLGGVRADNHVVLRCTSLDGREQLPVAWFREEGAGRVFVSTLGHTSEQFDQPLFVESHLRPALRWVMRRATP